MTVMNWLLNSEEPWTRYHALVDLLGVSPSDPEVEETRRAMLQHASVRDLISRAGTWGTMPIKRHNDASHALYAISTLADFGLHRNDSGMDDVISSILAHRSPEGILQSLINIPRTFGGDDTDRWTWSLCDAPTLL